MPSPRKPCKAEHLEPAFFHQADVDVATNKLKARRKKPNILIFLLGQAGYTTQAVGKWHIGENVESQPQHVGYDAFYGFLSVSDMYTEWRDPHFLPEIVYSEARTDWVKNMPFNRCFVRSGDRAASRHVRGRVAQMQPLVAATSRR